jgi:hypothetical protein
VGYYRIGGEHAADGSQARALREGGRLYASFHRFPPRSLRREACRRRIPGVLVDLGELRAVVYRSDRGSPGRPRTYVHFMESSPRLACDVSGRRLYILGGRYRVTERGIEG